MMEALEEEGQRGSCMASFLRKQFGPISTLSVLDAGCNTGGISLAFASAAERVVGIDRNEDAIRKAYFRAKANTVNNISHALATLVSLPFRSASFDLVIVNGVLEWVPGGWRGNPGEDSIDPRAQQLAALKENYRVLRRGGILYLAIENRWFPYNLISDTHTGQPLVAMLPRRVADKVSKYFWNRPYVNYLYSYWGLKRLIAEAGFKNIHFYVPVLTYHFPAAIVDISQRRTLLEQTKKLQIDVADGVGWEEFTVGTHGRLKRSFAITVAMLGLQKLFAQCFVVLAKK